MRVRFSVLTVFAFVAWVATCCGWYLDHMRLSSRLASAANVDRLRQAMTSVALASESEHEQLLDAIRQARDAIYELERGQDPSIPVLLDALRFPNRGVEMEIAYYADGAFRRLGPRSVPYLLKALSCGEDDVERMVWNSITSLGYQHEEVLQVLIKARAIENDERAASRLDALIEQVRRAWQPESLEALQSRQWSCGIQPCFLI